MHQSSACRKHSDRHGTLPSHLRVRNDIDLHPDRRIDLPVHLAEPLLDAMQFDRRNPNRRRRLLGHSVDHNATAAIRHRRPGLRGRAFSTDLLLEIKILGLTLLRPARGANALVIQAVVFPSELNIELIHRDVLRPSRHVEPANVGEHAVADERATPGRSTPQQTTGKSVAPATPRRSGSSCCRSRQSAGVTPRHW